jgi:hypothetical protein
MPAPTYKTPAISIAHIHLDSASVLLGADQRIKVLDCHRTLVQRGNAALPPSDSHDIMKCWFTFSRRVVPPSLKRTRRAGLSQAPMRLALLTRAS